MSQSRGFYKSLTIRRKLEIIDAVEKAPVSKKKKELAAEFNIPPSSDVRERRLTIPYMGRSV